MRSNLTILAVTALFAWAIEEGHAGSTASAAGLPPHRVDQDAAVSRQALPPEIVGTVRINGCAPTPSAIRLRALPLTFGAPGAREVALDPRKTDIPARLMSTPDPHAFSFSILGLHPRTQYRLSIFVPADVCGKVFWRGPTGGLAVSGGPPVEIEGFAATTSLEVLQPGTDLWVGADHLDFTDPHEGTRRFRWRSTLPGVVSGELQISTAKFPNQGAFGACDEPVQGVVHRQSVPAVQSEWAEIGPVNFNRIFARRVVTGGDVVAKDSVVGLDDSTLRLLLIGAPVYVRVVPVTASGPACDTVEQGVPAWVIFAKLPRAEPDFSVPPPAPPILEPGNGHVYIPPYLGGNAQGHPTYGEVAWKVIKPHLLPTLAFCAAFPSSDPSGCALVQAGIYPPGSFLQPGPDTWYFYFPKCCNGSNDPLAALGPLGAFVTASVNAVGLAVTTLADLYNDVVKGVENLAFDVLVKLDPTGLCSSHPGTCEAAINTGMTIGLTAMGLPPSLPNWDKLEHEGIDYLAGEIGDELEAQTGVPSALTDAVLKDMANKAIEQMAANRGIKNAGLDTGLTTKVIPYLGFDPATWIVAVQKHGTGPLPDMVLRRFESSLYRGGVVPLPRNFPPSGVLRVPMVLQPNLAGINAPLCVENGPGSTCSPINQCVPSPFVGCPPNIGVPFCKAGDLLNLGGQFLDCSETNLPSIYYRDAWTITKFLSTECIGLPAATFQRIGPFLVSVPGLTFAMGAIVDPRFFALWSGAFFAPCSQ